MELLLEIHLAGAGDLRSEGARTAERKCTGPAQTAAGDCDARSSYVFVETVGNRPGNCCEFVETVGNCCKIKKTKSLS